MANAKSRKMLSNLFRQGVEIRFGLDPETKAPTGKIGPFEDEGGRRLPPQDGEVSMFVCPVNPMQREKAIKEASSRRARAVIKARRDPDSEEHLTVMAFLADMSDETLIDYLVIGDFSRRLNDAEKEVLLEKEWADRDLGEHAKKLEGFDDLDPEELHGNPEWEAIMEVEAKFVEQVTKREVGMKEAYREALRIQLQEEGRAAIEARALERRAELTGTRAFVDEYELQMLFHSVREYDAPDQLFFESAEEYAQQPALVRNLVSEAVAPFVAISEGTEDSNES